VFCFRYDTLNSRQYYSLLTMFVFTRTNKFQLSMNIDGHAIKCSWRILFVGSIFIWYYNHENIFDVIRWNDDIIYNLSQISVIRKRVNFNSRLHLDYATQEVNKPSNMYHKTRLIRIPAIAVWKYTYSIYTFSFLHSLCQIVPLIKM